MADANSHEGDSRITPSNTRDCEDGVRTTVRRSDSGFQFNACLRDKVKLQRAYGGCLGDKRRRRTWEAAISFGELLTSYDPKISEWDNPFNVW